MSGLAIGLVALLVIVVSVIIVLFVARKKTGASCTPSDDEKATAGGDGVLAFVHSESGTCVANTCIDGYTFSSGICAQSKTTDDDDDDKNKKPADDDKSKKPADDDKSKKPVEYNKNLEGKSIRCNGHGGGIYRIVDGKYRDYGSMAILKTWDQNYKKENATIVNCDNIPKGPNMSANPNYKIDKLDIR
jgi:hypothetical protein